MIYCSWFLGSMCHIIISLRIWCLSPRTKWSPLLVVFPQRRPLIGQKGPTVPIGSQTKPLCLGYILYIIYIIWYVFIYIYYNWVTTMVNSGHWPLTDWGEHPSRPWTSQNVQPCFLILGQALKFVCETCRRWCLAEGDVGARDDGTYWTHITNFGAFRSPTM